MISNHKWQEPFISPPILLHSLVPLHTHFPTTFSPVGLVNELNIICSATFLSIELKAFILPRHFIPPTASKRERVLWISVQKNALRNAL